MYSSQIAETNTCKFNSIHHTVDHRLYILGDLHVALYCVSINLWCVHCFIPQLHAEEDLQNLVFPMKSAELEGKHGEIKEKGVDEYR